MDVEEWVRYWDGSSQPFSRSRVWNSSCNTKLGGNTNVISFFSLLFFSLFVSVLLTPWSPSPYGIRVCITVYNKFLMFVWNLVVQVLLPTFRHEICSGFINVDGQNGGLQQWLIVCIRKYPIFTCCYFSLDPQISKVKWPERKCPWFCFLRVVQSVTTETAATRDWRATDNETMSCHESFPLPEQRTN
jgi:hypothetical protein